eukprot:NODE_611_length_2024_cov_47.326832_g568_i0.p1 GENE.NODE_611_length_2024_cov_47.326832_g568_i0~~NODE_611_length_2024_cov_47.326832_g568_i0.p1  ORF type:complete len:609 (+),score=164.63 NODE_611_length_2024_cov_47.326832_g568_i0:3-1829(+)
MVVSLEGLHFDNRSLAALPLDHIAKNFVRTVPNACFSRVSPTPVENPSVVGVSMSALALLDLPAEQINRPEFAEYMSGNRLLPGCEPAAHCYCGHQFGHFSGQLGDGATMYLGEVLNQQGDRWEIQFKGAGKTPFSRTADGRKVLRSSLREFLCSEANHFLNVPTTRAGCLVTSDSQVIRDLNYDGHARYERCSIVLRIAPTFLRFGSFEIFKGEDPITGRAGPSVANHSLQETMLKYLLQGFYAHLVVPSTTPQQQYLEMYREVVHRTATLVAHWQTVGFCHGVLNTDNMSLVGLTIDYGPFGFMETYDPDYICNASDNSGRYSYKAQPAICRWNLAKLAEAWAPTLPQATALTVLPEYDAVYLREYTRLMSRKLGLLTPHPQDGTLIEELLDVMHQTGADWTHTFRLLSRVPAGEDMDTVVAAWLQHTASPTSLAKIHEGRAKLCKSNIAPRQLSMLLGMAQTDPEMLVNMVGGGTPEQLIQELRQESEKIQMREALLKKAKDFRDMSSSAKAEADARLLKGWLVNYTARVEAEDPKEAVAVMRAANPAFVLRNWICQLIINKAEQGDNSLLQEALHLAEHPFDDVPSSSTFATAAPDWAADLSVT